MPNPKKGKDIFKFKNWKRRIELLTGRVGSGNGSDSCEFDKSVILQYLNEYCSDLNDFTVIGFVSMRRIQ